MLLTCIEDAKNAHSSILARWSVCAELELARPGTATGLAGRGQRRVVSFFPFQVDQSGAPIIYLLDFETVRILTQIADYSGDNTS